MKKRKPQRSKNKALKKKKNQQQQQARLLRKLQREFEQKDSSQDQATELTPNESISVSEMNTSDLAAEKISSLSSPRYRVYSITASSQNVGYCGVFQNGYFYYSITVDGISKEQFLAFIKDYIRRKLNLIPVEKPQRYPIP